MAKAERVAIAVGLCTALAAAVLTAALPTRATAQSAINTYPKDSSQAGLCVDADADGVCVPDDCNDSIATCTTDCTTDADVDGTPNCADSCLDADGDGYGTAGPGPQSAGPEFRVNSQIVNTQADSSVSPDGAGGFVVVWQGAGQGDTAGVFAQRYSSVGGPVGAEFRVNSYTTSQQSAPAVSPDGAGGFVIAWHSNGQDGNAYGVFAQRYSSAGGPLGGEFRVNSYTTDIQMFPSVSPDGAGGFVVAWGSGSLTGGQQDGSYGGIYAQRYSSAGGPLGGEFRVNTTTADQQWRPSASPNGAGGFVVAWQGGGPGDAASYGVFAQRYSSAGGPLGGEFRVNSYTTNQQRFPSVSPDGAGGFVVAWESERQESSNSSYGVFAQRYSSSGGPVGGEFRVNSYTTNAQRYPTVSPDGAGNFVVAWQGQGQGDTVGVFAQRYSSSGGPVGGEFRVNVYTTSNQAFPSVSPNGAGGFVVAWNSLGQDFSFDGIFARRYGVLQCTGADCNDSNPRCSGSCTDADGDGYCPPTDCNDSNPQCSITCTDADGDGYCPPADCNDGIATCTTNCTTDIDSDGTTDCADTCLDADGDGLGAAGGAGNTCAGTDCNDGMPNCTTDCTDVDSDGTPDCADACLDADGDGYGTAGPAPRVEPAGTEFRVNSTTGSIQLNPSDSPDGAGGFVVVWWGVGQSELGVFAQRYSSVGGPLGGEFLVNSFTPDVQGFPSVSPDGAGGFVVAWESGDYYGQGHQDGSAYGVFAQRYSSAGGRLGGEFRVNSYTTNSQNRPSVAPNGAGGFVVVWQGQGQGDGAGVFAQRYSSVGGPLGSEFRVNSYTTSSQVGPSASPDGAGGFVVAWQGAGQGDIDGVFAQRYSSAGGPLGGEFRVNSYTTSGQNSPSVSPDGAGGFVVAWNSNGQDGSNYGVFAQRYSSLGGPVGGEFRVNLYTTSFQRDPSVSPDSAGGFVVAWEGAGQGTNDGVFAQRYTSAGGPLGGAFKVNSTVNPFPRFPSVSPNGAGGFVVAWQGGGTGDVDGVFAQRYRVVRCVGADCNDSNPNCSTSCTDADGDGYCAPADCNESNPNCSSSCTDTDGDGYCPPADCNVAIATCTTDCTTNVDSDGTADCADTCLDADGDGYGVAGGAGNTCAGTDCNDSNPHCSSSCTDADGDGYCLPADCNDSNPHCSSSCTDADGDGYCSPADCNDSNPHCSSSCTDSDGDGYCSPADCNTTIATCTTDCTTNADSDGTVDCADSCIDADGDGYGVAGGAGNTCAGTDCNEGIATCRTDCTTNADSDGTVDCADTCIDVDGDGYGVAGGAGNTCTGADCNEGIATCTTDCTTNVDSDGTVDCADNCLDADGDGYGVAGGAGNTCAGTDCNEGIATCTTDCTTNADSDGTVDCADSCIDADGDGYGVAGGAGNTCAGTDCNEGIATCTTDCTTNADSDATPDCADSCLDADGDGYGVTGGAGNTCAGADCNDGIATCRTDCTTDADADATPDCADGCLDADGDGYGVAGGAGNTCAGADCNEGIATCSTDCTTNADADATPDCADSCLDADGDGYGVAGGAGNTCAGTDCNDGIATCRTDCTTNADSDGTVDCADTCIDVDGDGYGVAGGAGNTCTGADCNEGIATCRTDCTTNADSDGTVDCADNCLDADGDGYGVAGGAGNTCTGADCNDSNPNCSSSCTDVDGDGYCSPADCNDANPNCSSSCTDADGDGYCATADCNDGIATCTTNCAIDADSDGTTDCADTCLDADGDGFGVAGGAGNTCAGTDCAEGNTAVWSIPGEVRGLNWPAGPKTTLQWLAPVSPGGTAPRFDAVRSPNPANFLAPASCIETDDDSDLQATDASLPASGALFSYLIRAGNVCGEGTSGVRSNGTPRSVLACP